MDRPAAGGFLSLTALRAEGCGIALTGDEYYNAAFRRSRPHRVSYSFLPSYIPSPLRGPLPLKGTQERYRICLSSSYVMKSITVISHLRWLPPPLVPYGTTFPPGIGRATKIKRLYGQARRLTSPDLHILCRMCTVDNKATQSNPFTQRIAKNKVPPPGGRRWRQPPKGVHFPRPQVGCTVFAAKGGIKNGAEGA